jgi:hypothetical protein
MHSIIFIHLHISLSLSLSHSLFRYEAEVDEDDLILPVRYYPESLQALSKATRFSEDEIKRMYRSFKAQCPTGFIREVICSFFFYLIIQNLALSFYLQDTFKDIYSQFFPFGGL